MANEKLKFVCDYMEGAHPAIMNELLSTNMMQTSGYGLDEFSESARDKIRKACGAPNAGVYLLVGGTAVSCLALIGKLFGLYKVKAEKNFVEGIYEEESLTEEENK